MVRDPLDLRRYTKIEDSDDLTQALVEEIIEKCLGFEVEQRSLVASNYLEQAEYDTCNPNENLTTQSLIKQLIYNLKLQAACPIPFDEANLWKGRSGLELKQKIQQQFRNISAGGIALSALVPATVSSISSWAKSSVANLQICSMHGLLLTIEVAGLSFVSHVQDQINSYYIEMSLIDSSQTSSCF
ncbi:hypothetical protein JHK86_035206 [Glycine max]|nr:hypothetical protein JHK86_035206 [Glycine max]